MRRVAAALLALSLGLAGCFRAHGVSEPEIDAARPDAALHDAGRDAFAVDSALPDAGPPDTSVPDAGTCMHPGIGRPNSACVLTATGTIPSGEPFTFPLGFARCECPETRSCSVAVDGDHIALTTAICDDVVACDECELDVGCALPALAPGHYFIDVDGARTLEVDASPRFVPPVAHPLCAPIPRAPDPSLVCDLDARSGPSFPMSVCRPALEDVGRYVRFEVVLACASCFDADGGCETQLDGTRLVLHPHVHRCDCPTCGACDPTCVPLTVACVSPPLSSGSYDIIVAATDGEHFGGTIDIRDVFEAGDRVCTEVP
jgi:hypothetical protein